MVNDDQGHAMLTHHQVWAAIEALARRHGLTASGLARRSGLDPTTFNRSKRVGSDGRQRWPSTESVAKILEATNMSLDEFLALLRDMAQDAGDAGPDGFEEPEQARYGADSVRRLEGDGSALAFPGAPVAALVLIEVVDEHLLPVYKSGDRLVARKVAKAAAGDRIAVAIRDGSLLVRDVVRKGRGKLVLQGWNPAQADCVLSDAEIDWTAKILWASQ